MDVQTFYTVYGDDAVFVAREYNKTDATITYLGSGTKEQQLAAQSINRGQLETVLRDLLHQKMCKVEVWASKPNTSTWIRIKKVLLRATRWCPAASAVGARARLSPAAFHCTVVCCLCNGPRATHVVLCRARQETSARWRIIC